MTSEQNIDSIFGAAVEIPCEEERRKFLQEICGQNVELRNRIELLLKAHGEAGNFMPERDDRTIDARPTMECPGSQIGPYKLRECLGEGGMGVVWAAEQSTPIRRKVALKLIKPGMDSEAVVARFEAEREALALMDHPNIARVLDAGTTNRGRPYFVMELIRGVPITEFCDANKMPVLERLALFMQVCKAVQHAHQKGIIHRDIKPTNVLVTLHDDRPVPKVIDFGVAKALHQPLTKHSIYTGVFQAVGTLAYMSPEQAQLSGLDIDTRADIYGLGVLLYEMLTGTTPFDKNELASAAFDEACRIIREKEPSRPSVKISTLGETAAAVSVNRGTDLKRLTKFMSGDLDVVVMKALEKDRRRRYETASAFADDIQRILMKEPIVARSPTLAYRMSRYVSRNRVAFATTALVLCSLVLGMVTTTWMAWVANDRATREQQTVRRLGKVAYDQAVAKALAGDYDGARQALAIAKEAQASAYQIAVVEGLLAVNAGYDEEAKQFAEEALVADGNGDDVRRIGAHSLAAIAYLWGGAIERWEDELAILRNVNPESDTEHLLMAYALVLQSPPVAIGLLKSKSRIFNSPVGLLIRCEANVLAGLDQKDLGIINEAVEDGKYAQSLCQNSSSARAWRLQAITAAIELSRLENRDVASLISEGQQLAEDLGRVSGYSLGEYSRWMFYTATGKAQEAWFAISSTHTALGDSALILASDSLRRSSVALALAEFQQAVAPADRQGEFVRLALAHLTPDGPQKVGRVRELVLDLVNSSSPLIRRHALAAICLVADPAEVRMRGANAPKHLSPGGYQPGDLFNGTACLRYLTGEWSEEKLLRDAGDHGYALANAHFTIGMMRLAEGDRAGAVKQFEACVDTHTIGSIDYEFGRAYVARMKAEPDWPQLAHDPTSN